MKNNTFKFVFKVSLITGLVYLFMFFASSAIEGCNEIADVEITVQYQLINGSWTAPCTFRAPSYGKFTVDASRGAEYYVSYRTKFHTYGKRYAAIDYRVISTKQIRNK